MLKLRHCRGMATVRIIFALTLLLAGGAAFAQFSRELRLAQPRMNGNDVKVIQERLLSLGFAEIGEADGWFGPKTELAVKKFQEYLGFAPDGIIGREAYNCLLSKDRLLASLMQDIKSTESMKLKSYKLIEDDIEDRSTEGGQRKRYYDNGQLAFVEIGIFGELGKVEYRVSRLTDRYLIRSKLFSYPSPFDVEHATVKYSMYYWTSTEAFVWQEGKYTKGERNLPRILDLVQ
ncbi:MAG: peptidoglycan-binding domain-containing protein [Rectinemataceae bacterium]